MAVLDPVVGTFLAAGITGQTAEFAQGLELLLTAGDELVDVRLMPDVPDEAVTGRVEHAVEGEREFDDPEVGAQVTARARDRVQDELAEFDAQPVELLGV